VVAVDSRKVGDKNIVHTHGGSKPTELETEGWIQKAVELGAGEILLTSMDHDGTKSGFADELLSKISSLVNVPVIASGGAGNMQHFCDTFTNGKSDAALAASIFHFKEIGIPELKAYLKNQTYHLQHCFAQNMDEIHLHQ
jgi:cyclase